MEKVAMMFANPQMLWLLLITIPLLTVFLWWAWQKKQSLIARFVQSRLLANLTVGVSPVRQKIRSFLLVTAVALIFVALAQPQWGFAWEEARQRGLDILVAIDTSRSMLAEDIPPNRLTRAKLAALDLMKAAKSDRLGLIGFAGTAFLQCPLTIDDEAFRQSIAALDVGVIPQGGTALTEAIDAALATARDEADNVKVLVIFTDGEDHEEGAVAAAKKAAKAGLRIFTVGVGTAEGELLRVKDEKGTTSYVKDDSGNVVKSRLNETLLREIAEAANGFYLPLRGASVIEALYKQGLAPLPKSDIASRRLKHFHERFQWPLGLAILLLIVESFVPDRRRVGRSEPILAAPNAELRKAVALLVAVALPATLIGSPSTALKKYQNGKYDEALQEYQRLLERKPDDQRLHFNAGAAAYKAKEFESATKNFGAALQATDLNLQQQAYYNLGDTFYQQGEQLAEPDKKIEAWEQSVKGFSSAVKLSAKDADAKHNLEFVKKRLEELKKQQQKSKSNQNQKDDSKPQDQEKDDANSQANQKNDPNADSKDQSKQQEQNKQDQASQKENKDQDKSEQEKKQSESAAKQDQQKDDQSEDKKKSTADSGEKSDEKGDGSEQASATPIGQMTREQARQLLDSQKGDEKVMMFLPNDKAKSRSKTFKDW
ncbi:MAG: VWA domain-containing protein [Verrucomicrobiota bacterium]